MINKREIIDEATRLGLSPHVIEKDYVLGWVLWAISGDDRLAENWLFKGGTCLKKCFFETYRFSEDLDFTLTDPSHLDADFLGRVFATIGERIYDETGIEFPSDAQKFDVYENPRGQLSCQGKIGYRGPVSSSGKNVPRIKLDLTADERVVLGPVSSSVFHPYSDEPESGIAVQTYAYEEAFAEKTRALAERARPRDLYDVINLFRNTGARPAASVLLDVLQQKCDFKGISIPALAELESNRSDLEGAWSSMLGHQLPALPPAATFWDELPDFFEWLSGGGEPQTPVAYAIETGEKVIRERILQIHLPPSVQSCIEIIRFSAANRLCVALDYGDKTRLIEPYSLRRTRKNDIILHAHNVDSDEHRSYRVEHIQGARVTSQTFVPRFEIELSPQGPVSIRPTAKRNPVVKSIALGRSIRQPRQPRSQPLSRTPFPSGPIYIYECSYCRRRFKRKQQTSTLNPHKNRQGQPCPGRYARWVHSEY